MNKIKRQLSLRDLGEYNLHSRILKILGDTVKPPEGPGDDASVITVSKKIAVAVCSDIVPSGLTGRYAGKFAVLHNYSDLLSVGAKPRGILISLGAPSDLALSEFDSLIAGVQEEAQKYKTGLLGGDTKEHSFYFVVGTAIGIVECDKILTRDGATVGDILALTRTGNRGWGRRWALRVCRAQLGEKSKIVTSLAIFDEADLTLPYKEMLALAKSKTVHAAIDCSDGLAAACRLLAKASDVGIKIQAKNLIAVLAQETIRAAERLNLSPISFCFTPGYDWECLLAIPKNSFARAKKAVKKAGGDLVEIGEILNKRNVMLADKGRQKALPLVGDMKFSKTNQYSSPQEWIKFAQRFSGVD